MIITTGLILFITVSITLLIAFLTYADKCRKARNSNIETTGTVISHKSERKLYISYSADGKEYKKEFGKCLYCDLHEGDFVKISYLKTNPQYAYPHTNQLYVMSYRDMIYSIAFFIVCDLLVLSRFFTTEEQFFICVDVVSGFNLFIISLVSLINENKFCRNFQIANGRIIYKSNAEGKAVYIAEYILNGEKNYTRKMSVPEKSDQKQFNIDDEVEVKYLPDKPDYSIISDDIYTFKKEKKRFIYCCFFSLVLFLKHF